jgi:hypothetical protein
MNLVLVAIIYLQCDIRSDEQLETYVLKVSNVVEENFCEICGCCRDDNSFNMSSSINPKSRDLYVEMCQIGEQKIDWKMSIQLTCHLGSG